MQRAIYFLMLRSRRRGVMEKTGLLKMLDRSQPPNNLCTSWRREICSYSRKP